MGFWMSNCNPNQVFEGCFPTNDMQTPLPLRSGHLDIKNAKCAKKYDGRKISYHIISRLGVQKECFGHPKIQLSSKVTKFVGKIGIDLILTYFALMTFFVRFLVFEI